MQGFSNKYKSFPEYIIGITKEIWEDRRIATVSYTHLTLPTILRV